MKALVSALLVGLALAAAACIEQPKAQPTPTLTSSAATTIAYATEFVRAVQTTAAEEKR